MGDILLMRSADAVVETLIIRESVRYLTPAGRRQAAAVGALLRGQELGVEHIVTSPLMRCVQTAELVAASLGFTGVLEAMPDMAPGGDAHRAADGLARSVCCVLAVGHEPGLSAVGALLCRGGTFHPLHRAQVALVRDRRTLWSLGPSDAAPVPAL